MTDEEILETLVDTHQAEWVLPLNKQERYIKGYYTDILGDRKYFEQPAIFNDDTCNELESLRRLVVVLNKRNVIESQLMVNDISNDSNL